MYQIRCKLSFAYGFVDCEIMLQEFNFVAELILVVKLCLSSCDLGRLYINDKLLFIRRTLLFSIEFKSSVIASLIL